MRSFERRSRIHPALNGERVVLRLFTLLATALCVGFGGCAAAQSAGNSPAQSAEVLENPRDPAALVVSYAQVLGEIADPDPGPTVKVFGDGWVVVHFPRYMKRAGQYEVRLGRAEMWNLVSSLAGKLVLFDATATRQKKQELQARFKETHAVVSAVMDASTTVIGIYLSRYKPGGIAGEEIVNVQKKVSWVGLKWDAKKYPQVEAIQDLAPAQRELQALMKHPFLEKVR